MSVDLRDLRTQIAIERGFIRPDDDEVQQAIGLETMHQAPLNAVGAYAVAETTTVVELSS
jgi:hypothetical protein